jgi:hypothetical protein
MPGAMTAFRRTLDGVSVTMLSNFSATFRAVAALAALITSMGLLAPASTAQEAAQSEAEGQRIQVLPSVEGESNGFRAGVLMTSDENWLEKFQNPGENGPEFILAPRLEIGKPARLLIFFAGAFPADGRLRILCDLRLTQGGEIVHQVDPEICSEAADPGDETSLLLADTTLVITPTEQDRGKVLKIEVVVTDGVRGEFVPMELTVVYGLAAE